MSVAVAAATTQLFVVGAPALPRGSWQHGRRTVTSRRRQPPGEDYRIEYCFVVVELTCYGDLSLQ